MAKLDKFLKLLKSFSKADNLDEPAEGYIYNILDTKNGKNYVGSKLGAIDKTENYLGSGTIIRNIANKRPDDLYKTILGKTSTRRELMTQEEAWLKAYRAAQDDNMYNLTNNYFGGEQGPDAISKMINNSARRGKPAVNKGIPQTQSAKEKFLKTIEQNRIRREKENFFKNMPAKVIKDNPLLKPKQIVTQATKDKISKTLTGSKLKDSTKSKISKKLTGVKKQKRTQEHKDNIAKALRGKKLTEEHKNNIRKGLL